MAIAALAFSGIIYGYTATTDQAEWSSYSLAAQSLAMQGVEQARSAKWDPHAWPPIDEIGVTNYATVEELDVPVAGGRLVVATNYFSIVQFSSNPPLRQIKTDCVWVLAYRGAKIRGPFTNTAVTLRAADQ